MPLTVDAQNVGTSEAVWRGWEALERAAPMVWGSPGRVVVVAPHPDDEVLAVGGTMRRLAKQGAAIHVVSVTDGEASHPRSRTVTPAQMAERRALERAAALARLGVGDARVSRLRLPDGRVVVDATLIDRLAAVVRGASWCLAPWERDGHPDHDATGRAASLACAEAGVAIVRYPVWAWHWSTPEGGDLPTRGLRRVMLDAEDVRAKRVAVGLFESQVAPLSDEPGDAPILPATVLARFQRPFEVVFA